MVGRWRESGDEKCDGEWCDVGAQKCAIESCRMVITVGGSAVSKKTKGRDEKADEGVSRCCCCRVVEAAAPRIAF
jgi:hypothetical protein